uniref:Protein kinase domain-containing protein n=1 Tax=Setaria viridis TaxID=4556 RepID=A0A4U6UY06_SETVI|nr:hypothetical protein SEVIR_5G280700v2 [Setaria viridis]
MSAPRLLATIAAHLPRLPVLLFVFVAVHVPASHGDPAPPLTTYDDSMCPESSRCGDVSIKYPFYLSNTIRYIADYNLLQGNGPTGTPVIRLDSESYTVLNISYDNKTIILADSDVLRPGKCPVVSHDVSFDEVWLRYSTSSKDNLTFFFGCDPAPAGVDTYRIDCNGLKSPFDDGASFVLTPDDHGKAQEHNLAAYCKNLSVPVRSEVLKSGNKTSFTSGGYGDVLRQGFELAWLPTDECHPCDQSGGKCSYNQYRQFLGCLCSSNIKVGHPRCTPRPNIVASTSCLLFLSLLILAFFLTCKYGSLPFKSKNKPRIESFLHKNVKRMTKFFAVKLGQGGFGAVYKGNLSNGGQVAVKMLKDVKCDGEELMNEVASISRTSHVNVVTLLRFCLEGSKRALIYEYMPNGSLERYVFISNLNSENTLSREKLFDIAIGIARGLEYLHRCIVYFDIKPQNILLDHDFRPKISDFGLGKLCLNKGERYLCWWQFGIVSSKSDVYSYGMMVLEMVGARDKNINADSESMIPTDRPTMTRVVEMLEGSTSNLELPPKVLLG